MSRASKTSRHFLCRVCVALATAALLHASHAAKANLVEWEATGLIQEVRAFGGIIDDFPSVAVGSPFTITFRFNAVSTATNVTQGENGMRYLYIDAIESLTLVIGNDELTRTQLGPRLIDVWDDYVPVDSDWSPSEGMLFAYGVTPSIAGTSAPISLTFRGWHNADVVAGPGLPAVPPELLTELSTSRFMFRDGLEWIAGDIRELRSTAPDSDGDGMADDLDNCIAIANADQRDTNADGFGNLCDPDLNNDCIVNVVDLGLFRSVFFSGDVHADFDGDAIVNTVDLALLKAYFFAAPGPAAGGACSAN